MANKFCSTAETCALRSLEPAMPITFQNNDLLCHSGRGNLLEEEESSWPKIPCLSGKFRLSIRELGPHRITVIHVIGDIVAGSRKSLGYAQYITFYKVEGVVRGVEKGLQRRGSSKGYSRNKKKKDVGSKRKEVHFADFLFLRWVVDLTG